MASKEKEWTAIPEALNDLNRLEYAGDMGDSWEKLALALKFKETDIERLKADYAKQTGQSRAMLGEWVRKNADNSLIVDVFADKLRFVGLNDLAKKVEARHNSSETAKKNQQKELCETTDPLTDLK